MKIRKIVKFYSKYKVASFSYLLSVLIALIVFLSGGTNTVYPNFMYIPIVILSSNNGKKPGLIHAVISGLLVGPFMPLIVHPYESQHIENWLIRIFIYMIISFVVGLFADYYKAEIEINKKNRKELVDAQQAIILSLVKLAESRDGETGAHVERVAELCQFLVIKLKATEKYAKTIDDDYINDIYQSCTLHDIGKVGIPDLILLKPGKLTPDEFEIVKKHSAIGADTLSKVYDEYPNLIIQLGINIAHFHHEKWDGSGYPTGISQETIPLCARIMAIIDVYDALRSKRIYKEAYSHEYSLDIIKNGKGTHFDPLITDVFIENEKEIENIFEEITIKYKHLN